MRYFPSITLLFIAGWLISACHTEKADLDKGSDLYAGEVKLETPKYTGEICACTATISVESNANPPQSDITVEFNTPDNHSSSTPVLIYTIQSFSLKIQGGTIFEDGSVDYTGPGNLSYKMMGNKNEPQNLHFEEVSLIGSLREGRGLTIGFDLYGQHYQLRLSALTHSKTATQEPEIHIGEGYTGVFRTITNHSGHAVILQEGAYTADNFQKVCDLPDGGTYAYTLVSEEWDIPGDSYFRLIFSDGRTLFCKKTAEPFQYVSIPFTVNIKNSLEVVNGSVGIQQTKEVSYEITEDLYNLSQVPDSDEV